MARAYSQDLRDRVIEATGNGTSARKAAARFKVGASTAVKWVGRVRDTGERSARRQGRPPGSKLDRHRDFLLTVIEAAPDTTIEELQRRLAEAAEEEFLDIAPGPWLIGRVPWSEAEHRIRAMAADDTIADALDIDPGAPCLVVERRTWSAEHPVTHVRFVYPAESHTLVARFTPSQG